VNLRKKIEGVLTRQAAKQAGAIRAALRNSLDVDALVADWERQNFITMSKADARAWAQMNAQPRNQKALRAALLQTIATGYLLGQDSSQAFYAKAKTGRKLVKAAPTAEDIDNWLDEDYWDSWVPGNKPAALLVKPPGALSDLLDKVGATINGLNRTTMNRLGTILGDGIERGFSGKTIGDAIDKLLNDPSRALTIANTEMARAMSTASMETYNGFGVEKVEWLHADSCLCDLCIEAEGMGPQPIGTDFGDGVTEPPMHPNCICAVAPVIDEGDGSGLDLADFGDVLEAGDEGDEFEAVVGSDKPAVVSIPEPLNTRSDEAVSEQLNFQRAQGFTAENNPPQWDMAVTAYTDGSGRYNDINGYLREGEMYFDQVDMSPSEQTETLGYIASLDSTIDAAPPLSEDTLTFRGIAEEAAYDFLNLEIGDQFTEAGYASTSWDRRVAENFAREDGVVLQIVNPAGTQGLAPLGYQMNVINQYAPEKEWLLPRGTTFDVISKRDNIITVRVNNEVPRVR
jgi:hypothetical protein